MDTIHPLKYGQQLYLYTPYNFYLFGRGFINRKVYLSEHKSPQCIFVFEQKSKNYTKNNENHDTIIYGTELVLKHKFSDHFLCIEMVQNEPELYLSLQENENCYFELSPQRNFEQNGQIVTMNSFFAIQSSHNNFKQCCLSSFLRSDQMSPGFPLKKKDSNEKNQQRHLSQLHIRKGAPIPKHHKHKAIESISVKNIRSSKLQALNERQSQDDQMSNQQQELSYSSDEEDNMDEEGSQVDKQETQNFLFKNNFRKQTNSEIVMKKTVEIQLQERPSQQNHAFKKIKKNQNIDQNVSKTPRLSLENQKKQSIFSYLKYFNLNSNKFFPVCKVQTSDYSFWKVQLKPENKGQFVDDNDYVQFIYSNKSDGILNIAIDNFPFQVKYETNKGEEQELFSSFFKVEIQNDKMYLKHILTNLYFPLNPKNEKVQFQLIPVCNQEVNQLPVYEIKFAGKAFEPLKSDFVTLLPFEEYKTDAFYVNKVQKHPINEILSCEGISEDIWINYFKEFLNKKGKKGQKILKQVQFLKYIVQVILPKLKKQKGKEQTNLREQAYKLLFKACLFNPSIKRYLIENHIEEILKQRKKEFINDLIIQLLESGEGLMQKYITPEVIGNVIKQMIEYTQNQRRKYSISYMRLFRIFCGKDSQSCVRNQNIMFNYFFTGKKFKATKHQKEIPISTQSYAALAKDKAIQIDEQLKFQICEKQNNEIYFKSDGRQKSVDYFLLRENQKERDYLRQYFYLLADTMRNENSQTIEKFTNQYEFKLLMKILTHPRQQYAFLKGPVLSLILTAYIAQVTKFKFYIFYSMYPKICYKGKILAQNISENYTKLLQYIKHQIQTIYYKQKLDKTHFNSTAFKHFLSLIKLSIQCALWNDQNQLLDTIQWLEKVFQFQQNVHLTHQNYQEKLQASNLMTCKILAVQIYTLYVDLQINMCISQLLQQSKNVLTNQIINDRISDFYRKSCNWNLNKLIFKICSTQNSQLMKKSLFLFKKIYNIKSIVEEEFNEARKQLKQETQSMKDKIGFIKSQTNIELLINTQEDCQNFIRAIFNSRPKGKQISLSIIKSTIQSGQNIMLDNIYRYDKPNHQFQELCYKLGIHNKIIQTITSYLNLRKKQQDISKKQTLSNQLFLLLALIKSNLQLKEAISECRHLFINLLSDDSQLYYISCEILNQIYNQNRKLIVSDTKNLQKICNEITECLKKGTYHLKNKIDLHHSTKQKIKDQFKRNSIKKGSSIGGESLAQINDPIEQEEKEGSLPNLILSQNSSLQEKKQNTQQDTSRYSYPPQVYQNPVIKDSDGYRYISKKQSIYHNTVSKSLTVKDCKLFFFLLTFLRIQNKKIEKNQKIILKNVFNKDNLMLIEQKIKAYDNDDNLIEIFKVLIYHLLESLGKNPDILFPFRHSHSKLQRRKTSLICFQGDGQFRNERTQSTNLNLSFHRNNASVITEKSLNNLIMSIRFKNWQLKKIVYKILESKVKYFKITQLRDLMRFIQIDLALFCEMLHSGQTYDTQQNGNVSSQYLSTRSIEIQDKKRPKMLKNHVEAFVKCSPFIVKTLESIMIKLRNYEKEIKSQILTLLVINVEKLFLLRKLFSLQVIQAVQNLPINLEPLLIRHEQNDSFLKSIDLGNLYKIKINDWSLKELQSETFKSAPLISELENKWQVTKRQKTYLGKNTIVEQILPEPFLLLLNKQISRNPLFVRFPDRKVLFPTQQQVLKYFILNLIKVNSSDSNVLSDQLKTFFLTYLSNSYLQPDHQQNEESFNKSHNRNQQRIKIVDKDKLPQILNEEEFQRKQDLLIQYEIPLVVCTILEEGFRNRYDLFFNMFELVNRLLEGGNTKGQAKFLTAFRNDHKNTIFQNISTMMMEILQTIKFYYTNQNVIPLGYHSNQSSYQFYQSKYERKVVCKLLCDVFRFLQLLCENNNRKMKNYIFSQYDEHDKIKYLSVNFVHNAIQLLYEIVDIVENNVAVLNTTYQKELLKEVRENLLPIPNSILDFLIQVCQIPAFQNQIYLCKTDFFKVISKMQRLSQYNSKFISRSGPLILSNPQQAEESLSKLFFVAGKDPERNVSSPLSENILFCYQRKLIILFRSLLEQQNQEIITIMGKKLSNKEFEYFINQSLLHGGLQDIQKLKVLLLEAKLNHHLETIVDVLIVKKILNITTEFSFTGMKKQIILSLQNRIQSIDINFQNQNLTVYFPSHPLFDLLTDRTKKFFIDKSIVLKSRNQKLRDFIISRHVIYQDIQNQKNAQNKIMNDKNMRRLCNLSIGISYVIIALLILFYSVSKSGTVLDVIETQIISGISLMQLIVTLVYTVLWGINIAPITKQKLKTKQFHMSRTKRQIRKMRERRQKQERSPYLKGDNIVGKYWIKFKEDLSFIKEIYIEQSASFHVMLLLFVSLVAFFIQVRVYSFTLIFVFAQIQLLQSILKAIRLTWKQLIIVCLLAVVFSFIFGFLTINNYIIPLYENEEIDIDINRINDHCNSIASCIKSLYTQRIIGQSVNQDGDEKQFVSDLVYWGFFEILLTNIIAAIIIDKFAEQRNAKQKIENERHNRCYVCSADKPTLQRKGIEFSQHINKTHYLWNYFYYMYTLERLKDSTQFTGIEYWIEHQIKNCKIQWIPLDQSKRDDFTQEKIDLIYDWVRKNTKAEVQNQNVSSQTSKSRRKILQTKTFEAVLNAALNKKSDLQDSQMQFEPYVKIKKRKDDFIDESGGQQSD